jgi:hypothetical protein
MSPDITLSAGFSVATRESYPYVHVKTAELFCEKCVQFEKANPSKTTPEGIIEYRSYSLAAVVGSACFLEAAVNELFFELSTMPAPYFKAIKPEIAVTIGKMWKLETRGYRGLQGYSILDKYGAVLALTDKPAFDKGAAPYQDARLVLDVRNALVHGSSELITVAGNTEPLTDEKLEVATRGKFPRNPYDQSSPKFPPGNTRARMRRMGLQVLPQVHEGILQPPRYRSDV